MSNGVITAWALAAGMLSLPPGDQFDLEKIADGVYAAVARPAFPLNCNAAVIINEADVVVVDSHGTPRSAEALLRQIRKITALPVRYVVNTHFHSDHVRGNPAYMRPYPHEVTIVSTHAARERLRQDGPAQLAKEVADIDGQIAKAKAVWVKARTPEAKQAWQDRERWKTQLERMKIVLPTLTFDRSLVLHRASRDIYVLFLGRGHTDGDAVVYLPKEKTAITGDLVSGWGPGMDDGFPNEWPAALDELSKLEIRAVMGGHGKPGGKEMITRLRAYLVDIIAEIRAVAARGGSVDDAQHAVMERVIPKHRTSFVPGELEPRVPGNVTKIFEDLRARRY